MADRSGLELGHPSRLSAKTISYRIEAFHFLLSFWEQIVFVLPIFVIKEFFTLTFCAKYATI